MYICLHSRTCGHVKSHSGCSDYVYVYIIYCCYIYTSGVSVLTNLYGELLSKPAPPTWPRKVREQSGWIGCCDIGRSWGLMFYESALLGVGDGLPSEN